MPRFARVVATGVAHHITQRGNCRAPVFDSDSDCHVYLNLLQHYSRMYGLALVGYCLMPNHVHLVGVPADPKAMHLTLRDAHGRYASYVNARRAGSGHLWQGRYYSCPMDDYHLWTALRYVERNPVRAGIVAFASDYPWSSAALHSSDAESDGLVDLQPWQRRWTSRSWQEFLNHGDSEGVEVEALRRNTHTGRPLGGQAFVRDLEISLNRPLAPSKGGRPRKNLGTDGTFPGFDTPADRRPVPSPACR